MRANVRYLTARLRAAPAKVARAARNAINDTARETAITSSAYLVKRIEAPQPGLTRKSVGRSDKATKSKLLARVYLTPGANEYLRRAEFGLNLENASYGIGAQARNARGDLKKGFRKPAIDQLTSKTIRDRRATGRRPTRKAKGKSMAEYFVGRPKSRSGERAVGIYRRTDGGESIKLVTAFLRKRRFRAQLGMRDHWRGIAGPALRKNMVTQLKHPANRI